MSDWQSAPHAERHKEFLEKLVATLIECTFESVSRENPVLRWREPAYLQDIINFNLQEDPKSQDNLLEIASKISKYSVKTGHPYFMNQLFSGLDPYGLAGQWLTDALNSSVYTYEVAPVFTLMERTVIKKLLNMFYTEENGESIGDGLFCPGGSFGNGTAINLARFWFRKKAQNGINIPSSALVVFASEDAHYSISKWGNVCDIEVVLTKTDEYGRMDVNDLRVNILEKQKNGCHPFSVFATAGTTVLGVFDPLIEIADICDEFGMWLHVDAAWGGGLIFSKKHSVLLRGIQRADSILFNPHKLLAVPQQCSLLLTRHRSIFKEAHSKQAPYLFQKDKFYPTDLDIGDKYLQCGRRPDVLKFWFMWQAKGTSGFEKHVDHLMTLSTLFKEEIGKRDGFKLVTDSCFINVCFWYIPPSLRFQKSSCDYGKRLNESVGLLETYRYLMEDAADPRVADWLFMGSPFPLLGITFLYLLFVLRLGPLYMKHRKPYNLNKIMIFYNTFMATASATAFYGLLTSGFTTKISLGCEAHTPSHDSESYRMARWVWRVVMLKVFELSDTVIFILRKKYNQASFLHIYHHASTVLLSWIACKFVPGGMWTFTIMLNSIVHVIMYTYYLLACLGPGMQRRIAPWKQYITGLQMVQFIIMICHTFQTMLPSCEPNRKPVAYIYMSQILMIFYMFCDYYRKSYLRRKTE